MRGYATGLLARDQCRIRHRCGVTRRDSECPIPLRVVLALSAAALLGGAFTAPVAHAQCLLRNVWGYGGVDVDGIFGPRTRSAVIDMQRRCGIAPDGIVGPNTWNCLHP